jgi:hypothetical protein
VHLVPEVRHRTLFADQHTRPGTGDIVREDAAVVPRGNRVDPEMAERRELSVVDSCHESPEPASRDVLEEHSLDGITGAEAKDLVTLRLDQASGHAQEL